MSAGSGRATGLLARPVCVIAYTRYSIDARVKRYVASLLRRGIEVDVFALGPAEKTQTPGLRIFYVMDKHFGDGAMGHLVSRLVFLVAAGLRVAFEAVRRRYRLVHVHNMPNLLVLAALLPRVAGAKVILDIHDLMPEVYAAKFGLPADHLLVRLLRLEEQASARLADWIITVHEPARAVLVRRGLRADRIAITMNVADPYVFIPRPRARAEGVLELVYHGTITERLGPDLVLRAVAIARERCPGVRLTFIGHGEFLGELERLADLLGVSDCVRFAGALAVEELARELTRFDLGVVGNRGYTQAKGTQMLPVKMLECAAVEIPTVAPRLDVITYYFSSGDTLFYQPDDALDMSRRIEEAYGEPARLDALRTGVRAFNGRHNWACMETVYFDVIEGLSTASRWPGES